MIIFQLLLSLFIDAIFTDENNAIIGSAVSSVLAFITQPITFGWGRAFTLYLQGAALIVALAAIVVNGIKTGILINGGAEDESAGHYIFRSIWPIAVIAGCPTILGWVTTIAHLIISDLTVAATGIDYGNVLKVLVLMQTNDITKIISVIGLIVVIYYTVTVMFQCVKRQLQLTVLSVIGSAVAVMTVSENNAGDFMTLMKEMVGTAIITALQLATLMSAIALPATSVWSVIPGMAQPFVIVAIFAAIKQIPKWVERYTLAPQVSGQGGAGRSVMMAAGFAGRSAITKAVR